MTFRAKAQPSFPRGAFLKAFADAAGRRREITAAKRKQHKEPLGLSLQEVASVTYISM